MLAARPKQLRMAWMLPTQWQDAIVFLILLDRKVFSGSLSGGLRFERENLLSMVV